MDRKTACLTQAAACREKAEADPANRDHWLGEAIKWLERAATSTGEVAIVFESEDGIRIRDSSEVNSTVTAK